MKLHLKKNRTPRCSWSVGEPMILTNGSAIGRVSALGLDDALREFTAALSTSRHMDLTDSKSHHIRQVPEAQALCLIFERSGPFEFGSSFTQRLYHLRIVTVGPTPLEVGKLSVRVWYANPQRPSGRQHLTMETLEMYGTRIF